MSYVKTTEGHMQPLVDVTNRILDSVGDYIHSRHRDSPSPDFRGAAILVGHEEWRALGYCGRAIALRTDPGGAYLYDIRVLHVHEHSHFSIVENVLSKPEPQPVVCDCYYRIGEHNAKIPKGQQPGTH